MYSVLLYRIITEILHLLGYHRLDESASAIGELEGLRCCHCHVFATIAINSSRCNPKISLIAALGLQLIRTCDALSCNVETSQVKRNATLPSHSLSRASNATRPPASLLDSLQSF